MKQRIQFARAWRLPGTVLALMAAWTLTSKAQEFGYHDPIGPADWCGLSDDYEACCGGEIAEQSPINIDFDNVLFERPLLQAVFSGEEFPNGNARPTQELNGRVVITDAK